MTLLTRRFAGQLVSRRACLSLPLPSPSFSFCPTGRYSTLGIYYTRTNSSGYGYTRSQRNCAGSRDVTAHTSLYARFTYFTCACAQTGTFELFVLYWRLDEYTDVQRYGRAKQKCPPFEKLRASTDRAVFQSTYIPHIIEPIICNNSAMVNCDATHWIKISSFEEVPLNVPAKIARDYLFDFRECHFHTFMPGNLINLMLILGIIRWLWTGEDERERRWST